MKALESARDYDLMDCSLSKVRHGWNNHKDVTWKDLQHTPEQAITCHTSRGSAAKK